MRAPIGHKHARLVAACALLLAASPAAAKKHRPSAKHAPADESAARRSAKKQPPPRKDFPTSCEVDEFLASTPALTPKERLPAALALMTRMLHAAPKDGRDPIELWEYFLQRWAALFRARGDMDVLEAVDEAQSDAGFTPSECSLFYRAVLQDTRAVEYYRYQAKRGRLSLCFEPDELEHRLTLPVQPDPRVVVGRGLTRVPACETDELVAGIAKGGLRALRVQEIVAKVGVGEEADRPGGTYLFTHLSKQFNEHPDEAILAGFDAASRGVPADKRACETYMTRIKTKDACAVYKDHYKAMSEIPERCVTDDVKRCLAP